MGRRLAIRSASGRIRFGLFCLTLLIVGLFLVGLSANNLETKLSKEMPSDSSLQAAFAARVLAMDDPNDLLRLGAGLARHHDVDLAIIALNRGTEVAPSSRDIQLTLAWCLLQTAQTQSGADREARLAKAKIALLAASHTDPLEPRLAQLQTTYQTLMGGPQ